ncbi:hypothetical protein PVAP13_2NG362703 [Panicum virgatum]|uniref:Uncharacterized protein n=1 Tax=Panicum virgatum TaxID=38727 RepID=A0A8T0VQK5_PANVG|nr:hypothetical protein PVAP13_2NG362703 [Panicum virgatum]
MQGGAYAPASHREPRPPPPPPPPASPWPGPQSPVGGGGGAVLFLWRGVETGGRRATNRYWACLGLYRSAHSHSFAALGHRGTGQRRARAPLARPGQSRPPPSRHRRAPPPPAGTHHRAPQLPTGLRQPAFARRHRPRPPRRRNAAPCGPPPAGTPQAADPHPSAAARRRPPAGLPQPARRQPCRLHRCRPLTWAGRISWLL